MAISLCGLSTMAVLDLAAAASQAWLPMLVGTYTDTDSKGIYQYRFNQETGLAELTATTPARNPSFVIFSEDGRNVYAVDESGTDDDAIVAFRYEGIDKPLVRINSMPTGGKAPCNILQIDNHIYTSNYTGGSITEFSIGYDGGIARVNNVLRFPLVGPAPDKVRQQSAHLHCMRSEHHGRHIFACDLGNDCVYTLKLDAKSGGLKVEETVSVAPGSGPRHITMDAEGRYAYLITELSGEVMVFRNDNGRLTQVQTVVADDCHAGGSADIHLSPDGRFLYASNRLQGDGIAIFRVDKKSGTLTRVGYQPTARHPRNFSITPNGLFLLCACRDDNRIQVFAVDNETGLLTDTCHDICLPRPVCITLGD